ncbi:PD-(D/E)XK nuclease-like domain-containing protein [Bifidobacterium sp. SO1]|uniref:PD-(D/E)XK nuclease-like domain-containing protein n=1 Tax=Bifidobacterium sp. SO1 TaxID=2809029 RepID=UPI001BDD9F78|nr:PD-(D/E)XK nuclease-like domain-containing protein [Bifidobacterium sp. SO1]MBT1162757.1 PD-(D/E)XK nuclease-like domain-containing protein [Bifidobacterium sp. SO1]
MTAKLYDYDDPEYFAHPALDQSQLKAFLHNPADWGYNRLQGDHTPTPAMKFGTAFHAYLMNTATVVSLDEGETFQKKANQQWRDEQIAEGNIVVTYPDMQKLLRMKRNIELTSLQEGMPDYISLIENGTCEQCIIWTDKETGLELKAKPDLIPTGTDYLVDLKTAQSADRKDFAKEVLNYGYHIQAVFYRQAVSELPAHMFDRLAKTPKAMQFWVFEKDEACDWQPFIIGPKNKAINESAGQSIRQALLGIAEMVKRGEDAGLGTGVDAAARWAIRTGYDKHPKEVEFSDWQLIAAENMIGQAA